MKIFLFIILTYISLGLSAEDFLPLSDKSAQEDPPALVSFTTGGHSIYHLKPATINSSGTRVIITAAFDGAVLCYSPQGNLIWENKINTEFPFDLAVADINNDGFDESFISTAGGKVFAFNSDGSHLWTYSSAAPLFQVCPVRLTTGEWRIFTGGILKTVYNLTSSGVQSGTFAAGNVVRHMRKGNILGDGNENVAIATTSSGLTGSLSLILLNPNTMTQTWKKTGLGVSAANSGRRFFSMVMADTDKNGKENIIVSASWGDKGLIYGFDELGNQMLSNTTNTNVPGAAYRMNLLSNIDFKGTDADYIYGIFGNDIIIYNANGSYNSLLECDYDFANAAFDPETNTYYLGSSPSGGDGIYALNLNHTGWKSAFQSIKPVGILAKVEQNIATLTTQINSFVKPEYQPDPRNATLFTVKPAGAAPANLLYGTTSTLSQVQIPGELWCKNEDSRVSYNQTQEQILANVRQKEANKQNFALWAGHGTAIYMSPSTMEAILLEAPIYFKGFIFAEMEQTDTDMQNIVSTIIFPLAEKCSIAKKKIIFRNKNIFWTGTCYMEFWSVLLDPQFHDVFVPSLEETNSRTQEISLASRVGLWKTGSYDSWAERANTDNACFDRMWEWSSQQVMSHYIREMAMRASLGAEYYLIDISQAKYATGLHAELKPFYDMIGKGVIAIPTRDEILSVSDICLGMISPPNTTFLSSGANGHGYTFSIPAPMVFDRMDAYWGAAPLLDTDFSKYGYGADRRMLNFLPKYPYGLVTIVPNTINVNQFPWLKEKITFNGKNFFDESGNQKTPAEYKDIMIGKLEQSAQRLPVLVKGDVAWTVVKLDEEHIRITLIDPGYTDPGDRQAEIIFQHLTGLEAKDILSGESIQITDQKISTNVPAGILRVIDVKHEIVTSVKNPVTFNTKVYPNPASGEFTLQIENISGSVSIVVRDLVGRVCLSDLNDFTNGVFTKKYHLNEKGIFFLTVKGNGINHTEKIVCK